MEKFWLSMPLAAWSSPVLATRSNKRYQTTMGRLIATITGLWLLSTNPAHAVDLTVALSNLRSLVIPLTQMMLAFSFAAGLYMIWHAITMMKKFGMMNSMQSQPGEFTGPIAYFLIGAILVWIPTTTDIFTSTIFGI